MAYIKAIDSTCYNEGGITFPVTQEIDWDEMNIPYCWLQLHMSQPHTIVFDDLAIRRVEGFLAQNGVLARYMVVCKGDLIETTGYRYDEDTKRCLTWAKGVTLDGHPARVNGVQLAFGFVSTRGIPDIEGEWSWEAIRRIICKGGQFRS
jgi:hypothetical protein